MISGGTQDYLTKLKAYITITSYKWKPDSAHGNLIEDLYQGRVQTYKYFIDTRPGLNMVTPTS